MTHKRGPRTARAAFGSVLLGLAVQVSAEAGAAQQESEPPHAAAEYALALAYRGLDGQRVDPALAVVHLQRAAEMGHLAAQLDLAFVYLNGSHARARDPAQAFRWFALAADRGAARAVCMMGDFYRHGWGGVPIDPAQAVRWSSHAARSDDRCAAKAQFDLYGALESGVGAARDLASATYWLKRAAEGRHPKAQFTLGRNYTRGHGVEKDADLAAYWLRKSREGVSPHDDHDFGDDGQHAAVQCPEHPQGHPPATRLTFSKPLVIPGVGGLK